MPKQKIPLKTFKEEDTTPVKKFSVMDLLDPGKMNEFEEELQHRNKIFYGATTDKKKKELKYQDNFEDLQKLNSEDNTLIEPND